MPNPLLRSGEASSDSVKMWRHCGEGNSELTNNTCTGGHLCLESLTRLWNYPPGCHAPPPHTQARTYPSLKQRKLKSWRFPVPQCQEGCLPSFQLHLPTGGQAGWLDTPCPGVSNLPKLCIRCLSIGTL